MVFIELIEMEERHRKEMDALHEKYQREMINMKEDVEKKIERIIERIDITKV